MRHFVIVGVCLLGVAGLAGCGSSTPTVAAAAVAPSSPVPVAAPSSADPSSGSLCLKDAAGSIIEAGLSALEAGNQTAAAAAGSAVLTTVADAATDPACAKAVAAFLP
jgi:hypothetical protein